MGDKLEDMFSLEKSFSDRSHRLQEEERFKLDRMIYSEFKTVEKLIRDRLLALYFAYNLSIIRNSAILDTILTKILDNSSSRLILFDDIFKLYSKYPFLGGKSGLVDIFCRYITFTEDSPDVDTIEHYLCILADNLGTLFHHIEYHLSNVKIIVDKVDIRNNYWIARSILTVLDKILTKLLNEKIYRLDNVDERKYSSIVDTIAKFYFQSQLLESHFRCRWFGGIIVDGNSGDDHLKRLEILVWIKIVVVSNVESEYRYSGDEKSIIDLFSDQDDQLCELLVCNIMINERKKSSLNDHLLLMHLWRNLNFTNDVFLDWIVSPETLFLPYFVRYLKLLRRNIADFRRLSSEFSYEEFIHDITSNTENESENLLLNIYEYVGDTFLIEVTRIRSPSQRKTDAKIIKTRRIKADDVEEKILNVLQDLHIKLKRFNDKKFISFNINYLLKLLSECQIILLE